MTNELQSTIEGVKQSENIRFEAELMSQLRKDFELIGSPLPSGLLTKEISDQWLVKFEKHLFQLNNHQNDKLIQLLYRIDVDEKRLINLKVESNPYYELAHLIIEREKEKVRFRQSQQ